MSVTADPQPCFYARTYVLYIHVRCRLGPRPWWPGPGAAAAFMSASDVIDRRAVDVHVPVIGVVYSIGIIAFMQVFSDYI